MTPKQIIELGTSLGLYYDKSSQFPDALAKGRVVFDGFNGQRFLIESDWPEKKILEHLGSALIAMGKMMKAKQIYSNLSSA